MSYLLRASRLAVRLYPRTINAARARAYSTSPNGEKSKAPETEKVLQSILKYERVNLVSDIIMVTTLGIGTVLFLEQHNRRERERIERMKGDTGDSWQNYKKLEHEVKANYWKHANKELGDMQREKQEALAGYWEHAYKELGDMQQAKQKALAGYWERVNKELTDKEMKDYCDKFL